MKGWRPKRGWKNQFNPAAITVRDRNGKPISHHEAFEAGADAMYESAYRKGVEETLEWCRERHYLIDFDLEKFIQNLSQKNPAPQGALRGI